MPATSAVSRNDGEVLLKKNGRPCGVRAKVIIGADGPHSRVAKWIGSENRHRIPAVQVRAPLVRPMEFGEVYFHSEIRGGYGWLFPKRHEANVGLGMIPGGEECPSLRQALQRFLRRLAEAGKIEARVLGGTAGWVPAESIRRITRDKRPTGRRCGGADASHHRSRCLSGRDLRGLWRVFMPHGRLRRGIGPYCLDTKKNG